MNRNPRQRTAPGAGTTPWYALAVVALTAAWLAAIPRPARVAATAPAALPSTAAAPGTAAVPGAPRPYDIPSGRERRAGNR